MWRRGHGRKVYRGVVAHLVLWVVLAASAKALQAADLGGDAIGELRERVRYVDETARALFAGDAEALAAADVLLHNFDDFVLRRSTQEMSYARFEEHISELEAMLSREPRDADDFWRSDKRWVVNKLRAPIDFANPPTVAPLILDLTQPKQK